MSTDRRAVAEPTDELGALAARSMRPFEAALGRVARVRGAQLLGRRVSDAEEQAALAGLATLFAETMTLADLLGRRRLWLEARDALGSDGIDEAPILFADTPVVPNVPFAEAARDIEQRTPVLADPESPVPRWRQIADLYQERMAFGLARSADLQLTERVQEEIEKAIKFGTKTPTLERVIADLDDWSRAYAEVVYRTNLNTAYSAGRFQQARDPDVARAVGAFEFVAVMDSAVRPNHAAAHGLVASQFDPIWDELSPPLGYNCRCSLGLVDRFELQDRGLVKNNEVVAWTPPGFRDAHPDPGFERKFRPDRAVYG